MLRSPNSIIAYITTLYCICLNSYLGRNIALLHYKYGITFSHNLSSTVTLIFGVNDIDSCKHGLVSCTRDARYYTKICTY